MRIILFISLMFTLTACALGMPGSPPDTDIIITDTPVEQATNQPSLETLCQHKGYTWSASDSSCRFNQSGNPAIEIFYPIELVYDPLIDPLMETYITGYRANFEEQFAQHGANSPGPWQLNLRYVIHQHSESIISIEWAERFYSGGANVGLEYTTFTFDRSANQQVNISDLFVDGVDPLATLQQPVRDALTTMLADISTADAINNGTDDRQDFSHFILTENDLVILFEPYTVAAGVAGPQRVTLSLSDFQNVLKEQFQ